MLELSAESANSAKVALTADVLHRFGSAAVRVTGSSMLPAIWPGDVVTIEHRRIDRTRIGEIAVFVRHDRLFAHRVVAHSGRQVTTKGDSVCAADEPLGEAELLGVVVSVSRRGRRARSWAELNRTSRVVAGLVSRFEVVNKIVQRLANFRSKLAT